MSLAVRLLVPKQRIGVAIVGFDNNDRILMLQHVFHPSTPWGLPGGWMNRDESPADCAHRELEEETGLSAELGPIVYVSKEKIPPHIGIAYMAKIQPGPITLSSEIIEAQWYGHDTIPEPVLPFTREAILAAASYPYQESVDMRELYE
jgi:ADP-ribose pyrophosphatase YjhB (NUDIX family)